MDIVTQLIDENMCIPDICPCDDSNVSFYHHCYLPMVDQGRIEEIPQKFLNFLEQMEEDHDCSGFCEKPNFFFFRTNDFGTPSKTCFDQALEI